MNIWACGNYPKVAEDLVAGLGPLLVESCGIGPGRRVLDVGAGCGNASIAAAAQGAGVVASDLTPELLAEGRERAAARGLELEWVEADARSSSRRPCGVQGITSASCSATASSGPRCRTRRWSSTTSSSRPTSAYETVRDDPQRLAALDRDFLQFAEHANRGTNGRTVYEFEYLLARGRKR